MPDSPQTPRPASSVGQPGPVVLAHDGSDLALQAISAAAAQLAPGREAIVVCVWQTGDVGFLPVGDRGFDAWAPEEVARAAREVADHGAEFATRAGFRATGEAIEAAPTWEGLVEVAQRRPDSLIVIGSHRRSGLLAHFAGSVADATVSHFDGSVLVIRQPSGD